MVPSPFLKPGLNIFVELLEIRLMKRSHETEWLSLFPFVCMPEKPVWIVEPTIVHKRIPIEDDVIPTKITQISSFLECKTRKATMLEVRTEPSKKTQLPRVIC